MAITYESTICAVPSENAGMAVYVIDSLRRKFSVAYQFTTRENDQTDEVEVICVSNFPITPYALNVMRGKQDFRG